jgi:3-isopropylmalate/(R)-2-methylmalate dehydratase small subunit
MSIVQGKVLKYGDNINTDIISPPQYMELSIAEAAKYAMSAIDPDFATKVQKGDILVAGANFGSGSSRETSPLHHTLRADFLDRHFGR